ncbi:hypothetical protein EB093_08610 [bacterium]|nr:hypothetical protein [bacterium]
MPLDLLGSPLLILNPSLDHLHVEKKKSRPPVNDGCVGLGDHHVSPDSWSVALPERLGAFVSVGFILQTEGDARAGRPAHDGSVGAFAGCRWSCDLALIITHVRRRDIRLFALSGS